MNSPFASLAAIGLICLLAQAEEPRNNAAPDRELRGWGKPLNPDGDCEFFMSGDGRLLIQVPGGARAHDLAADIQLSNAPRVVQSANGDFTLQVRIDGRFEPGDESTKSERIAYNGAGIIAMVDPRNVVTLARAVLQHPGDSPVPYANFEIRSGGKLLRMGMTDDLPLPEKGPVYLRLERRGGRFLGAASTDGATWSELSAKEVPATWPKKLQIGLIAISTSTKEFNPGFSNLQVIK